MHVHEVRWAFVLLSLVFSPMDVLQHAALAHSIIHLYQLASSISSRSIV